MIKKKYFVSVCIGMILSFAIYGNVADAEEMNNVTVHTQESSDAFAEGQEAEQDMEETTYTVTVNNVGYTTLQDAVDQAESNSTIILNTDIQEKDIAFSTDKALILDLNGYMLDTNKSIINEKNLTITDSKQTGKKVVEVTDGEHIIYIADDSVNIDFLGGSLRMDYKDSAGNPYYTKTSLRFGYQIYTKNDVNIDDWKWDYGTNAEKLSGTVIGKKKTDTSDGFVSNLVVTDIPYKYYETKIYSKLYITYDKGDGKSYLLIDDIQSRTVLNVVNEIIKDSTSTAQEVAYAKGLKSLYDEENKWTGYH